MAWDIAVAGTVHIDEITTPAGHRADQLGGSAVYFALAAARFATVHLNGIVGSDARGRVRRAARPRRACTATAWWSATLPTFRWHARHDFERWVAVDTTSEEGCDPTWRPGSRRGAAARRALPRQHAPVDPGARCWPRAALG